MFLCAILPQWKAEANANETRNPVSVDLFIESHNFLLKFLDNEDLSNYKQPGEWLVNCLQGWIV